MSTRPVPRARTCGSYTPGHDVHFIQARLSRESSPESRTTIEAIDDDGTIHLADGTTLWNHDPKRLRLVVEHFGPAATIRTRGVLALQSYLFCVAPTPDPCRPTAPGPLPGESLIDEVIRRGGAIRRGTDVRAELDITGSREGSDERE